MAAMMSINSNEGYPYCGGSLQALLECFLLRGNESNLSFLVGRLKFRNQISICTLQNASSGMCTTSVLL